MAQMHCSVIEMLYIAMVKHVFIQTQSIWYDQVGLEIKVM